jgi:hypothetical protein
MATIDYQPGSHAAGMFGRGSGGGGGQDPRRNKPGRAHERERRSPSWEGFPDEDDIEEYVDDDTHIVDNIVSFLIQCSLSILTRSRTNLAMSICMASPCATGSRAMSLRMQSHNGASLQARLGSFGLFVIVAQVIQSMSARSRKTFETGRLPIFRLVETKSTWTTSGVILVVAVLVSRRVVFRSQREVGVEEIWDMVHAETVIVVAKEFVVLSVETRVCSSF